MMQLCTDTAEPHAEYRMHAVASWLAVGGPVLSMRAHAATTAIETIHLTLGRA